MNTEKIIKNQAKESLTSNWSNIIVGTLAFLTIIILITQSFNVACLELKAITLNSDKVKNPFVYGILQAISYFLLLCASPMANGILKMCHNVTNTGKCEIYDLFFFFRGFKRFLRTLIVNCFFVTVYTLLSALDLYKVVSAVTKSDIDQAFHYDMVSVLLLGALIVSVAVKLLVYLLFIHYPLLAYSLDDSDSLIKYAFGYIGFGFKNLFKTLKLLLSFAGWIALCFLVVPAFYVFPYLAVSMTTSAKWLFLLNNKRGAVC